MKIIIKILGTGCTKCDTLAALVNEITREDGVDAEIHKVGDIVQIMNYQVMSTPGLVINEKVVASGRVPSREEIRGFLSLSNQD